MKKIKNFRFIPAIKTSVQCLLLWLYKATFGFYLRHKYRVKFSSGSDMPSRGPFLLLFNHSNNYDGFFLQCLLPKPVQFLITDSIFKSKVLRVLFGFVGFIPKKKYTSDSRAVRGIIRAINDGGIVGISAEGGRNWDGKTLELLPATFKLVKLLKVPVFTAKIMGGYLSAPRWAETKRHGLVEIELKRTLDSNEISQMSTDEITGKIKKALDHNDTAWQIKKMVPFHGKSPAKGFERLLFICPECKRMDSIESKGDLFSCSSCGAKYRFDDFGFIHSLKGALPANNAAGLNAWQLEKMKDMINTIGDGDTIITKENAFLKVSLSDKEPFTDADHGAFKLSRCCLSVGGTDFNISELIGIQIYFKSELAFRYKACDYRISFPGRAPVYMLYIVLTLLREGRYEEGLWETKRKAQ